MHNHFFLIKVQYWAIWTKKCVFRQYNGLHIHTIMVNCCLWVPMPYQTLLWCNCKSTSATPVCTLRFLHKIEWKSLMACDNCDNPHTCNDDDLIDSLRNLYYYSCFLDLQYQSVASVFFFFDEDNASNGCAANGYCDYTFGCCWFYYASSINQELVIFSSCNFSFPFVSKCVPFYAQSHWSA